MPTETIDEILKKHIFTVVHENLQMNQYDMLCELALEQNIKEPAIYSSEIQRRLEKAHKEKKLKLEEEHTLHHFTQIESRVREELHKVKLEITKDLAARCINNALAKKSTYAEVLEKSIEILNDEQMSFYPQKKDAFRVMTQAMLKMHVMDVAYCQEMIGQFNEALSNAQKELEEHLAQQLISAQKRAYAIYLSVLKQVQGIPQFTQMASVLEEDYLPVMQLIVDAESALSGLDKRLDAAHEIFGECGPNERHVVLAQKISQHESDAMWLCFKDKLYIGLTSLLATIAIMGPKIVSTFGLSFSMYLLSVIAIPVLLCAAYVCHTQLWQPTMNEQHRIKQDISLCNSLITDLNEREKADSVLTTQSSVMKKAYRNASMFRQQFKEQLLRNTDMQPLTLGLNPL